MATHSSILAGRIPWPEEPGRLQSVGSQRIVRQAPLSMRFYRQEYWSGLPCPPPRDLPDPEIEPVSLTSPALADGSFTTSPPGSPVKSTVPIKSVRLF